MSEPIISSFDKANYKVNNTINITGTNFTGVTSGEIYNGTGSPIPLAFVGVIDNSTAIATLSPSTPIADNYQLRLFKGPNPGPYSIPTFNVVAAPTITSFSANPVSPGDVVDVFGTGFTNVNDVFLRSPITETFPTENLVVVSDTQLQIRIPSTTPINNYSVIVNSTTGGQNPFSLPLFVVDRIICFGHNSKILCLRNNIESEVLIADLKLGDLVKTSCNGYLPISAIGTSKCFNSQNQVRQKNRLYSLKKERYPTLNAELIVTGPHSILVDNLSDKQRQSIIKHYGQIYITDNKYRLPAFLDENSEVYNEEDGIFEVYNFALGNNPSFNYGIFANGLLVECGFHHAVQNKMMK